MKKVNEYSISLLFSLASLIIFTFIITLLRYFDIFSSQTISIFKIIIPIISILIGSILLGKKSLKKGWLEGIKFSIIFLIIIIIISYLGFNNSIKLKSLFYYIIIIITSSLGSMIGINTKKNNR